MTIKAMKMAVKHLEDAYTEMHKVFLRIDFPCENVLDHADLPAKITWKEFQLISKKLCSGLAWLARANGEEVIYMDGINTVRLREMIDEENKTAGRVQPIDGPSKGTKQPGEDSSDENCSSPAKP